MFYSGPVLQPSHPSDWLGQQDEEGADMLQELCLFPGIGGIGGTDATTGRVQLDATGAQLGLGWCC